MNAYELADKVDKRDAWLERKDLSNMLRQQADRIAELEKDLHMIQRHYDQLNTTPQTKPLTDEEIEQIANANVDGHTSLEQLKWFARAIEAKILGETK